MNVTIQQTPEHTTFDGLTATYCIARDALTGQRVAMFQVVQIEPGVVQYRTMDRRSMPPDFTFDDAIKLAMVDERRRRGTPPPRRRLPDPAPQRFPAQYRNIRPMPLPPDRGYRQPSDHARPMRRLLCAKLAERHARKAVA
jgi:hypothetical protein